MVLKKFRNVALALFTGLLLWAAWPVSNYPFIIFIAWIPLLILSDLVPNKLSILYLTFLSMLVWNLATTWWVFNSTEFAILAFLFNALFMCLPFWGYYAFKKRFGKWIGYLSLISFWMLFEYIHLNWQLSWPWLTLGNVFASAPSLVRWYSYTGVAGGTLWVFILNISIKEMITTIQSHRRTYTFYASLLTPILLYLIPSFFNTIIKKNNALRVQVMNTHNVLIIQPNIDPYEKNSVANANQQLEKLIQLSEKNTDSLTTLVIWPETALAQEVEQTELETSGFYQPVFDYVRKHPNVTLLTGIDCFKNYGFKKLSTTARKEPNGMYFDAFNSAVVLKAGQPNQFYNKSKLVPGVETLPSFLNFMAPLFEKFGGTTGGYGHDSTAKAIAVKGCPYVSAPIICYESIYGEYVTNYVSKGANLLTIITNDGWWGNTPGHKQHLLYARLRAIETNRYVARSANTGISALIDNEGNFLGANGWDKMDFIKAQIPIVSGKTFYVKYGDYLYAIFSVIALILIVWNSFFLLKRKFK